MGLVLLDERSFGEQRLRFVPDRHKLEVGNGVDHRPDLRCMSGAWSEISKHAMAQILGFADVYYDSTSIAHQVTTGLVRHGLQTFSENIVH